MIVTLPLLILAAALVCAASYLRQLHVQANRENADGELIALVHRIEHQRRLEQVRLQAPGRHRLREQMPPQ